MADVQLRTAVCGELPRVTVADSVQVSPAGVEVDTARLTVPVRPFMAATVIVEFPEPPAKTCVGETTPVEIEKSTIWNWIIGAVWASVPLAPVTVTV